MIKPGKILFLTLHTFSLTGGIEKVCKIFSKVMHDLVDQENRQFHSFDLLPLCDHQKAADQFYCAPKNFKGYRYNRTKFSFSAISKGFKSNTIVLSHVNLLAIAYFIKLFSQHKRIILFAHGIEVWRDLTSWKQKFLREHVEIWAVSSFTRQILEQKHDIPGQKIKILNNCLDPNFKIPAHFHKPDYLLNRYQLADSDCILLSISRMSSHELYKGYDLVIEAIPKLLKSHPNAVYLLAGKADTLERLRLTKLVNKMNLKKHVVLVDYIAEDELVDFFLMADIFVMPSKKEGFGIVFIEAAASGCQVIAGNQDGSADALLNGELGILIDPENIDELVVAIHHSLEKRNDQQQNLAQQEKCLSRFSYGNYRDQVAELLKN